MRPDRVPLRWYLAWEQHRSDVFDDRVDVIAAGVAEAFSDDS